MTAARRVLVVEDSRPVAVLLERALQGHGFDVTVVGDGLNAYDEVRKTEFDLILLDHLIPGMLGIELLEKLRADGHTMPILMISNVAGEEEVVRALRLGGEDFIRKPFSLREVMARIEVHLAHNQGRNG